MKGPATLLCLLLMSAALNTQMLAQPEGARSLPTCCFSFHSKKIPLQKLRSYRFTSMQCSQDAVIFTTKLAKEICANPKEKWVQLSVKYLQEKSQVLKTADPAAPLSPTRSSRNDSSISLTATAWTNFTVNFQ
ncbi:PREDICTED: C-C motif chemokine 13 [Condylura cristata]|uniref:C-C motif chemokine 13 n=1 Tax=Condylura cristata TaxID=143302 RepID=UPI0003346CF3|nr:PREDICTED: C-C motif chemokine 13 [Condylura cristata]